MGKIVQEKFQVNNPPNRNDDANSGWVSDKSARTRKGLQTRDGSNRFESYRGDSYNCLPPGMNINDQEVFAGSTLAAAGSLGTGSQVTDDVTQTSIRQGFDRKALRPTDDMYTREHNDAFYDSVEVDGVEGYVERNNMLDRM